MALLVITATGLVGLFGGAGYFLFTRPQSDPLTEADAIVILSSGDEIDNRIEYGLKLAERGYADAVLISRTLYRDDPNYSRACASPSVRIAVVCFEATPYTTRGEAEFAAELAKQHNWTHLIVVSWNFHIVRARYIFHQCYSGTVTMLAVPRSYDYQVSHWIWLYAYQYAAFVKARILGC
ncbi:protein of unknown function DUF218 [Mycolicibacterium rhodesiae JS60]|nr:protein of unknown function DUF218 [Mycolicibacterium rhodesiae JS60]